MRTQLFHYSCMASQETCCEISASDTPAFFFLVNQRSCSASLASGSNLARLGVWHGQVRRRPQKGLLFWSHALHPKCCSSFWSSEVEFCTVIPVLCKWCYPHSLLFPVVQVVAGIASSWVFQKASHCQRPPRRSRGGCLYSFYSPISSSIFV